MDVATRMLRSATRQCIAVGSGRSVSTQCVRWHDQCLELSLVSLGWIPVMPRLGKRKLHMQRAQLVSIANCFPVGPLVSSCILRILQSGGVNCINRLFRR